MKINASDFSRDFLVFVEITFPDLFKQFKDGDESAIENVKYLNFGYQLKNNQLNSLHSKFLRFMDFVQSKKNNTELDCKIDDSELKDFELAWDKGLWIFL